MITPLNVANNFIKRALSNGDISLTPMKLQKLIYFLYKEYLKRTGKRLFNEPFEAWKYGPVLLSIYDNFKPFGANPISRFAKNSIGEAYIVGEIGVFKECLDSVWIKYSTYSLINR